ncbi:hypothetical protein BV25DRAFT_1820752 [Artomyces pyxidatus]|uniref:Uncharacterized protein n=1 Tax=Artomyces pyxidatus TaxID=48021 RepID=A0ACB8TE68_9AGAM|nr:hypothetical protein BV25DRAFT_1820752 [Artomyces pyxidatus]
MASSGIDENLLKAMLTPLPLDDTVQGTDYPTSVDANRTNNFLRGVIASGTTGRSADLGDSHRTGRTDAWIDAQQNLSSQSSTLTQPTPATADPPIPSLPLRTRVSALKSATGPSSWPIPPPRSASSPLNPTAPVFTPRTNRNSGVGPSMAAQTPTAFGGSAWSLCSPASSASPATPHFTAQSNFATQRPVPSRLGQCVVVPMSPFVPRKPLEPLNTNIMGPGGPDAGMVGANPAQVCPFF